MKADRVNKGGAKSLATREREWQSSCEALLNLAHNLLHVRAFTPEGPMAPKVLIAAEPMWVASIWSNMTGWKDGGSLLLSIRNASMGG